MKLGGSIYPTRVLEFDRLLTYLEHMKFQAKIANKAEREAMRPEFERLLAKADTLAQQLAKEYPVYPWSVNPETYKLVHGIDQPPQKTSFKDWWSGLSEEDKAIY